MNELFDKVLGKIKLSEKETKKMNRGIEKFVQELDWKIRRKKIRAEVFVGGSSGKGTVVKRENQDIDIFVRFLNEGDINKLEELIPGEKNKIHGSRDYFKVSFSGLGFEVVPVLKISKPEQAKNVTDLSYFHVSYIKRKINEKRRLEDEVRLAKSFCFSQRAYGAEGYIRGFSGYALELLIIYYGGFYKMIKGLGRIDVKKKKLIVDMEGHYKSKKIEAEMNESKLISPIIFIDPTYKKRNVLAGLSYGTFYRFQESCKRFLKKPSEKFFFRQKMNKKDFNLILIAKTNRQKGDVAGSKLWKFYNVLLKKVEKYFLLQKKEFDYDNKKSGLIYLKIKPRKYILKEGPPLTKVKNAIEFKKKHKNVFIKRGVVFSKDKPKSLRKFLLDFKKHNKKRMIDMGIVSFGKG